MRSAGGTKKESNCCGPFALFRTSTLITLLISFLKVPGEDSRSRKLLLPLFLLLSGRERKEKATSGTGLRTFRRSQEV